MEKPDQPTVDLDHLLHQRHVDRLRRRAGQQGLHKVRQVPVGYGKLVTRSRNTDGARQIEQGRDAGRAHGEYRPVLVRPPHVRRADLAAARPAIEGQPHPGRIGNHVDGTDGIQARYAFERVHSRDSVASCSSTDMRSAPSGPQSLVPTARIRPVKRSRSTFDDRRIVRVTNSYTPPPIRPDVA